MSLPNIFDFPAPPRWAPTVLNVPLLRKTMEHIEAHPHEWEQAHWFSLVQRENFCGTAACFAGTAALLNGAVRAYDSTIMTPEGQYLPVDRYALWSLGLTVGQACELFFAGNSMETLRTLVDAYITEAEATP